MFLTPYVLRHAEHAQVSRNDCGTGEDVDLPCRLIETDEELEQITWQKSTLEETQKLHFMLIYPNGVIAPNGLSGRVQFIGNPSENLGSIRITAVRLLDEGTFTCIFSVFPSGAYTTEIPLTVLGKYSSFTLCITVSTFEVQKDCV
uniref:Ig-like domain-containing protein n=1 Tax=Oncorhynchus tshawytscha TaxID=74940 RepID=A0AAZ3QTQ4_ONCTS